jgi:hypothetical protein
VLSAPRLTVYPNQRANISVLNQLSFIQDFDAEVEVGGEHVFADPIVGVLQDGLTLDLVTAPVAGTERAVDVAFKLLVAELEKPIRERTVRFAEWTSDGTIQLPRLAINSVTGVRRIGIGQEVVVAELPDTGHGAAVDVLMRVVPTAVAAEIGHEGEEIGLGGVEDFAGLDLVDPGSDDDEADVDLKQLLASAQSLDQAGGRLSLELVAVHLDLEPGVAVAEETLRDGGALQMDIARLGVHTTPVPGATASALLQESYVADYEVLVGKSDYAVADPVVDTFLSGLTGTVGDDATLRLEWTTTPAVADVGTQVFQGLAVQIDVPERSTHTVTVPLRAGRQLVPIARMSEGRTAAVWVSFVPE